MIIERCGSCEECRSECGGKDVGWRVMQNTSTNAHLVKLRFRAILVDSACNVK